MERGDGDKSGHMDTVHAAAVQAFQRPAMNAHERRRQCFRLLLTFTTHVIADVSTRVSTLLSRADFRPT